jgi:hypothetical protein
MSASGRIYVFLTTPARHSSEPWPNLHKSVSWNRLLAADGFDFVRDYHCFECSLTVFRLGDDYIPIAVPFAAFQ